MALTNKEVKELENLLRRAQELVGKATATEAARSSENGKAPENAKASGVAKSPVAQKSPARRKASARIRRSGKDLIAFRKAIRAERKAGVPVATIAAKHGISPAYIYQLG
jgi:hypothetical protein